MLGHTVKLVLFSAIFVAAGGYLNRPRVCYCYVVRPSAAFLDCSTCLIPAPASKACHYVRIGYAHRVVVWVDPFSDLPDWRSDSEVLTAPRPSIPSLCNSCVKPKRTHSYSHVGRIPFGSIPECFRTKCDRDLIQSSSISNDNSDPNLPTFRRGFQHLHTPIDFSLGSS